MNGNTAFKDTRLLEVLDHIDESYLAEALEGLKFPLASAAPASGKGKILRSLKYVAAVAACALLMSTLIPVVQYVSGNLNSFLPSGWLGEVTTEDTNQYPLTPEEFDAINAAWQLGNFADSLDEVGFLSGEKLFTENITVALFWDGAIC
jgi:hypothetical protein